MSKSRQSRPRRSPSAKAPAARVRRTSASRPPTLDGVPGDVGKVRELFWNNVIREILTSLSAMSTNGQRRRAVRETKPAPGENSPGAGETARPAANDANPSKELATAKSPPAPTDPFDGRLAVIVGNGTRIPIAAVFPLFACGVPGSAAERSLSGAVECTVFQIHTPSGEVYTLPLHEIRGFHALSDELMAELVKAGQEQQESEDEPEKPFGFAAFTSLARGIPPANAPARGPGSWGSEPGL